MPFKDKVQKRDWDKRYREENLEKKKTYLKDYYIKNKEKMSERSKRWQQENAERKNERNRQWQQQNKHIVCAKEAKRRAAKMLATPLWADQGAIKALYKTARKLGEQSGIKMHVDHIVPLQGETVCGLHVACNLQIIPAKQNISKKNKF